MNSIDSQTISNTIGALIANYLISKYLIRKLAPKLYNKIDGIINKNKIFRHPIHTTTLNNLTAYSQKDRKDNLKRIETKTIDDLSNQLISKFYNNETINSFLVYEIYIKNCIDETENLLSQNYTAEFTEKYIKRKKRILNQAISTIMIFTDIPEKSNLNKLIDTLSILDSYLKNITLEINLLIAESNGSFR